MSWELEQWKKISGANDYYEVSNLGRVRTRNNRIRKQFFGTWGYLQVSLYDKDKIKTFKIHRIVALAFVDNPDKKTQVNHKDNNKTNNNANNLEWVTPKENSHMAARDRLYKTGEGRKNSVLTEDTVSRIRYVHKKGCKILWISTLLGVSYGTIRSIIQGISWKYSKKEHMPKG